MNKQKKTVIRDLIQKFIKEIGVASGPTFTLPGFGGSLDIHKAIGKLPKPKSGWTLPGHRYTGPYNDLDL